MEIIIVAYMIDNEKPIYFDESIICESIKDKEALRKILKDELNKDIYFITKEKLN